jgi:large subunit ribosomal protein L18
VTKSLRYIYAQVIDDRSGRTLAQANSLEKGLRESLDGVCGNKRAAQAVGEKVAERSLEQGIKTVVFDRGGYVYHGRIKALADAAREKGLVF